MENLDEEDLIITRMFDAPIEQVWKAWTEPEQLKRWFGPKGFTIPFCEIGLRTGGELRYCMRSPEDTVQPGGKRDYWSKAIYDEIILGEKLVYTEKFTDESGNAVPASYYFGEEMGAGWPATTRVSVAFERSEGKTKMTLRHRGIPAGRNRDGAYIGWGQSFDKLAGILV